MESRFQRILLTLGLAWFSIAAHGAEGDAGVLEDIINPDLKRRELKERKLDSEIVEIGFFAGVMSIEDFGSNDVYGGRLALHVTEDVFFELNAGASKLLRTSYEQEGGNVIPDLLTEEDRNLTFYDLTIGVNFFPGETYIGRWAFHHHLYLVGGGGNTLFANDEFFTYVYGGGFRLFVTDWIALRFDVRNHVLTHGLFEDEKEVQNLATHMGLTLFF